MTLHLIIIAGKCTGNLFSQGFEYTKINNGQIELLTCLEAFEYFVEMSRDYPEDFYLRKTFFEMNEWKSMKGLSLSNVVNDHMTLQSRKDQ